MTKARLLGPDDLAEFCRLRGVPHALHRLTVPTPTVPDAARAVGSEASRILKSLVFLAAGDPLLVIVAGESRVSYPALAAALGASRRAIRFASAEQALAITGYAVGAMPPFGHAVPLPTLLDEATVPRTGALFGGGGGIDALIEVEAGVVEEVTAARRAVLTRSDEATGT